LHKLLASTCAFYRKLIMCVMRNLFYKVPLASPTDKISSEIYARNSCTIYYCFLYGGAENSNLCSFNQRFIRVVLWKRLKKHWKRAFSLTSIINLA
jgi:hypothetical protein